MSDEVIALQLRDDATASPEPVSFGSFFPGLWARGKALPVDQLGMTVTEARDRIREHHLPLDEVHLPADAPKKRTAADRRTADSEAPLPPPAPGQITNPGSEA